MSAAVDVAVAGLGLLLIAGALRDVFRTLWRPSGEGRISGRLTRSVWRAAHRFGEQALDAAGPLTMVLVILVWAGLVVVGFALVYLPWLGGDGFVYGSGLDEGDRTVAVDALYVSAVVLSTLGFGDVVPSDGWLRLVTASEALIGFTLLTAGISWITQVQQALARRRSDARFLGALRRADAELRVDADRGLLEQVARDLARAHVDLRQSTTSYYFRERDPSGSLAVALPWCAELVRRGASAPDAETRAAAGVLEVALDDLAALLRSGFVRVSGDGREGVLTAYLHDHRHGRT